MLGIRRVRSPPVKKQRIEQPPIKAEPEDGENQPPQAPTTTGLGEIGGIMMGFFKKGD